MACRCARAGGRLRALLELSAEQSSLRLCTVRRSALLLLYAQELITPLNCCLALPATPHHLASCCLQPDPEHAAELLTMFARHGSSG
jgi:hypothetical protein